MDSEKIILANGVLIEVKQRVSSKAKNLSIHIKRLDQTIELVIPKKFNIELAKKFLFSREQWIRDKLKKLQISNRFNTYQINLGDSSSIEILGKTYKIIHNDQRRGATKIENNTILVSGHKEYIKNRVKRSLSLFLKKEIEVIALNMSKSLNVRFNSISIKDTKTRWGSCSTKGDLVFCWKLIFTTQEILNYVVAHEMCHLREMNHSKKFWNLVGSIIPDYKKIKIMLKQYNFVIE